MLFSASALPNAWAPSVKRGLVPGPEPQYIYVGNTDSVVRLPYKNGDLKATGEPQKITDLPAGGKLTGDVHNNYPGDNLSKALLTVAKLMGSSITEIGSDKGQVGSTLAGIG